MSEFAYFCFVRSNLLTKEEMDHKGEMIHFTEQVLDAEGLECDEKIAQMPKEEQKKILAQARILRRKKKRMDSNEASVELEEEQQRKEEILVTGE
jgi:hypothetical protein